MFSRKLIPIGLIAVLALFATITQNDDSARAQGNLLPTNIPSGINVPAGTSFTYQGMLTDTSDNPIQDTSCDFRFILYDADIGGSQVGPIQEKTAVPVTKASFTVTLDFGSGAFTSEARWLEIAVKCGGEADYTNLSPRQRIYPVPYSLNAMHSEDGVPIGAILIYTSTDGTCPTGYTRISSLDGQFIRGASAYGATGGSATHNHGGSTGNAGSHNHTISADGNHNHGVGNVELHNSGSDSNFDVMDNNNWSSSWNGTHSHGGYTGNVGDHSHTIQTSSNIPPYTDVVFCQKQ